jgi:hypothetical protein
VITGIDGTGPVQAIEPRLEDLPEWEARAEERRAAARRINGLDPVVMVTGRDLAGVTAARAEGLAEQGTIHFTVEETTMTDVRLRFPAALGVATGGALPADPHHAAG